MTRSLPRRQRGMTLFVGLIMLVLLLLMAISAFNLTRTNSAITGNMQNKMEATNAAMQAVEMTISTDQFINTPNNAVPNSCGLNSVCVDVNGDGSPDITVTLNPAPCIKKIQVVKNANLSLTNPNDAPCALGVAQTLGVSGSSTDDSLCAESVWEVNANASDAVTGAVSTVTTGVAVRVPAAHALDPSKACS
ncbi:MAG: hypothetical protein QMD17_01150 [Rhodocyclaceae bacterium]|jgi:hypothetical protein|nr:hypothetical protein [Rhodocyclaceae bacterium]